MQVGVGRNETHTSHKKGLWTNAAIWRVLKMIHGKIHCYFFRLHIEADAIQADFNVAELQKDSRNKAEDH